METVSQEEPTPYSAGADTIALAREAVRAGLIKQDVLDHLTSLHPQVPSSMKYRYLLLELHKEVKKDEKLFMKMLHVLFQPRLNTTTNVIFGPEHISELVEFLAKYKYKWELIGIALEFQPQDLSNIKASHISTTDFLIHSLKSLIEEWIGKKHKHTLPPTKGNLKKALNSHTVELGVLARELDKMFVTPKPGHSPYLVASVDLCQTTEGLTFTSTYSQNMNIYAEENGSVLLEIQATSELVCGPNIKYQWFVDDKVIPVKSVVHTGTTTPVLCISNADIEMDGSEYKCTVTADTEGVVNISPFTTIKVNCLLDEFTYDLAKLYTVQPEVPRDAWPPVSSTKHINLALIWQKKMNYSSQYTRFTIRGDMDDILRHKEAIEYNEVFKSLKHGQVIFIEGRPGSGKTTFVHKITRDWGITTTNRQMRLVFLVSLRVLNNINNPDLDDILNLFKDLKVSKELIEKRKGKGVCFIFDGLDEYLPAIKGENSFVYKIINKEYLSQSTVIVASRPAAIAELRWKANKVIEIIGFKKEQIIEYFDNYPFSDQSKSAELKAYLSVHPNILHMCYLPVHAAMVGHLFEVTGGVPQTETEIYTHFTYLTLQRNRKKSGCANDSLSKEEETLLNQICKFALRKTILNKQVLHQDEVTSLFKSETDRDISLGLITVDRTADLYKIKDIYTFLHLTFQEYLAAHHITTLSNEEQQKLIQMHGNKNHMLAVWKFYCGLIKFDVRNSMFKLLLHHTPKKNLFHIQCAYESQQSLICTQLLKSKRYRMQLNDTYLTTPDFTAMGYIINASVLPVTLSLTNCKISIELVNAILSEIRGKTRCFLQDLQFESCDADIECINILLSNTKSLKKLRINSILSIHDVNALVDGLTHCTELEELDISKNALSDGRSLATGLKHCSKLKRICIRDNYLTADGISAVFNEIRSCKLKVNCEDITEGNDITNIAFIHILQCCTNLQSLEIELFTNEIEHLNLGENWKSLKELKLCVLSSLYSIADKAMANMFNSLNHFSELQKLTLKRFKINDSGAESLAKGLSHCPNLQILDFRNSKFIGKTCISQILVYCTSLKELNLSGCGVKFHGNIALSSCRNLQTLKLCDNHIDADGMKALAAHLCHCTQLKELDLYNNEIGEDGTKALAENLYHCTQLNLGNNKIGENGAKALAANLVHCTHLNQLDLSQNNIGINGAKALATNLHHCTELKEMNLNHCKIGDEGAMALATGFSNHCTQLKELNFDFNGISADYVKGLIAKLPQLTMPDFESWDCMDI